MFYMVIQNDTIIDVLSDITYVRTQVVHNKLMICKKEYAEGILSSNTNAIYYDSNFIETNIRDYPIVTLIEIDETKYKSLSEILEINKTIDYKPDVEELDESQTHEDDVSEDEKITIEFVRESKIKEMSKICNNRIVSGFDICLSDGKIHHFDFSLEEQANIMFFKAAIDSGETMIPYHASNEPCRFFPAQDILAVFTMGTSIKTYETTYFNSLKQYIKSLEVIDDIRSVYYGMQIPNEFQSEVMIHITKNIN